MLDCFGSYAPPPPDFSKWLQFAMKWTPRAIVGGLAGYYCLGIAYETGIMAAIDRLAIRILRPTMGYIGIAAFMPTFQWYSAWGVRVIVAIGAGLLYDLLERILRTAWNTFPFHSQRRNSCLIPAPVIAKSDR